MNKFFMIPVILLIFAAGCQKYTPIENLEIGMTLSEVLALQTTCYYKGEGEEYVEYSCKFDAPSGERLEDRTVKPYVLTFENDQLTRIKLDERAMDRRMMRYRYNYTHGHYFFHY